MVARFFLTKLINKSVLRVHGSDSFPYLQTFLTNDIRHVSPGSGRHCLFSHIMNSMGRSLADVFIYQPAELTDESIQRNLVLAPFYSHDFGQGGLETDQVLIECDQALAGGLQRTLFAMKIRKNVSIGIEDKQVWVIYPDQESRDQMLPVLSKVSEKAILVSDPRLSNLAYRLITPATWNSDNVKDLIGDTMEISESNIAKYEKYRHINGISEGAKEQPEGHVFPLECNADLLNGMSLKKGMFSGDWITGRNYRKGANSRIVPFKLKSKNRKELDLVAPDTPLYNSENYEIGVIRARRGQFGLASVIFNQLKHGQEIPFVHTLSNLSGLCWIPNWWPGTIARVNETNIPDGRTNSYIIPESQQ